MGQEIFSGSPEGFLAGPGRLWLSLIRTYIGVFRKELFANLINKIHIIVFCIINNLKCPAHNSAGFTLRN